MRTNRDEAEMEAMKRLLREAMPPLGEETGLDRDLWPAMRLEIEQRKMADVRLIPWFDWAIAAGILALAVALPRAIPVLLYYL